LSLIKRINEHLQRLKLSTIEDILPLVIKESQEKDISYLSFLDRILGEEVHAREDRRLKTALRTAGLPFEKTIEEYDFIFHPELDRKVVKNLFELDFLGRRENVIFLGPPGVGKTHLAIALAIKACYCGCSIYFTTMADLILKLKQDGVMVRRRGRGYYKSSLVIIDEVGYTPITREEAHLFFQFVSHRYERSSTIITSNKSFSEWEELFGDPVIVTAILDRLLHHCQVINMKGKSYRLKEYSEKQSKKGGDTTQDH